MIINFSLCLSYFYIHFQFINNLILFIDANDFLEFCLFNENSNYFNFH